MISTERLRAFSLYLENRVEEILAIRGSLPLLVMAIATVLAVHWSQVAVSVNTVGPDYGHYLIAANWYAGIDRSGEGPFDPPFVPLIIVSLGPVIDRILLLQLLGPCALASAFVAAAFFLTKFVPRWVAIAGAATFVQWQTFLEFITSGGVTNLFGIAFSLVFYRMFYDSLERPRSGLRLNRKEAAASGTLFLLASTHHFTTFIVGGTLLIWLAIHLSTGARERRASLSTALRIIGPAALLSLIYLPYFVALVTTDARSGLGPTPLEVLPFAISYAWQDTPELWFGFFALATASMVRFRFKTPLVPIAIALAIAPIGLLVVVLASHPVRPLYFLPFPLVFLAVVWFAKQDVPWGFRWPIGPVKRIGRTACVVLLGVALIVLPGSDQKRQLDGLANYHAFMRPGMLEAFDWVASHTPPGAIFAVDAGSSPAFNDAWKGMATGWWLEGYANRRAIYEANPPLLPFESKWEDARDANRLFAGETIFEDGVLRVAESFPVDDAASPKVYTAYFGDFREFLGFAVPRVVDSRTAQEFTLVLGADNKYRVSLADGVGTVVGNYSGPGFVGRRSTTYDSSSILVSWNLEMAFDVSAPWDAIEMTIRLPQWTSLDLTGLDQGILVGQVSGVFESPPLVGRVAFVSRNMSGAASVPPLGKPGEGGVGLRWRISGPNIALSAVISISTLSSPASHHAVVVKTSEEILGDHAVDFLFVSQDSLSNIQRFDRQPARFTRAYVNAAVVIFERG